MSGDYGTSIRVPDRKFRLRHPKVDEPDGTPSLENAWGALQTLQEETIFETTSSRSADRGRLPIGKILTG